MGKICYKCKRELDRSMFSKCKSKIGGLQGECKECFKKYYKENRTRILKQQKECREEEKRIYLGGDVTVEK